jgi:CubicO group peptidase (beta-lactamase class C family)
MELRLPLVTLPVLLMLGELAIVGAFHAPCASLAAAAEETRPADRFPWRTAAPESQGMSSQKLDALRQSLAANATKILLIIRNDKIVYEWYAPGFSATRTHYTASAAKALVGGVSLAVAMTDGRIAMDDKAAKYVPQWRDDPRKSKITIRQLGSHTSGIEDAEQDDIPHDKLPGWKGVF